MSTAIFREGLRSRGLMEALELHMKDYPPENPAALQLMAREVKLAAYRDATRPIEERREAIAEANRILQRLIEENSTDPRRFEWQYLLGYSLLYEEGEPQATSILYTGGNDEDRRLLSDVTGRALAELRLMRERLGEELSRVDQLSIEAFAQIEQSGYLDQLEQLAPRAEYLYLWSLFYDCLARDAADPIRTTQLHEIYASLSSHRQLLETPQEQSGVQVPALLLAGMTLRRLQEHHRARDMFNRARTIAESVGDAANHESIAWAAVLADIESVHNDRDDGRWSAALEGVTRLRRVADARTGTSDQNAFGLKLVAALLERSVLLAQAGAVDRAGRSDEADVLRCKSWVRLAELARSEPARREELYAAVHRLSGPDAERRALDPVEQVAWMAGLSAEAQPGAENEAALLTKVVNMGESFLASPHATSSEATPEVLRYLAAALYRLDRKEAAAARFLELAKSHPQSADASAAARIAVQLAAEAHGKLGDAGRRHLQEGADRSADTYLESMQLLLDREPNNEAAKYWRFYYAQLLFERGEFDQAARQFAAVGPDHELYVESAFLRLKAIVRAIQERTTGGAANSESVPARMDELLRADRELVRRSTALASGGDKAEQAHSIERMLAEGRILTAETRILPPIARYDEALEALADFEQRFPGQQELFGRVWRIRLLAYEATGRLDRAKEVIPDYVKADPRNAGPTLQSLYDGTAAELNRRRAADDHAGYSRKAEMALLLATQLLAWADLPGSRNEAMLDRRRLELQLAESHLDCEHIEQAHEIYSRLAGQLDAGGGEAIEPLPANAIDLRILNGRAETLRRMGRWREALPIFNRLATALSPASEIRWKALLGDLQCRTSLGEAPDGIIKVIEQQKLLYPDMGGVTVARELQKILRENQRRHAAEPR